MAATNPSAPRGALLARLAEARARTDALFALVRPEALFDRPIAARHRIAFYIGHLEAFDWNLFEQAVPGLRPFQPEFDRLFAFGIDPVGGQLPSDQPSDWPPIEQIRAYAARVRQELEPGLAAAGETLLNVGIEHRLMHAETLAYMLSQLEVEKKIPRPVSLPPPAPPVSGGMVEIPAGCVRLGNATGGFGWDNEFEAHQVEVAAFAIDRHKVTNGQYLQFVQAGGYQTPSLWSQEAWQWISGQGVQHPAFWKNSGGQWYWKSMFGEIPLPLDWPVWVSQAEAAAYARWIGRRLPTEAEWQRAAYGDDRSYPWGESAPAPAHGNFDFARWDPTPVGAHPSGAGPFGLAQALGNGWEWTSTVFEPFPGFRAFPFYPGYSANFFDGRHFVLKGASPRTAACMLRRSFRNWFQPHYPYVYAGFRCVAE